MYKEDLALNNLQWLIIPENPIQPNHIYLIYMYKEDLALNNLQWLIIPENSIQPNHIYLIYMYKEDLALNNLQWLIIPENPTKPNHIYLIYMYKEDLALNDQQWLKCHKTQLYQNQMKICWIRSVHTATVQYHICLFLTPGCDCCTKSKLSFTFFSFNATFSYFNSNAQ